MSSYHRIRYSIENNVWVTYVDGNNNICTHLLWAEHEIFKLSGIKKTYIDREEYIRKKITKFNEQHKETIYKNGQWFTIIERVFGKLFAPNNMRGFQAWVRFHVADLPVDIVWENIISIERKNPIVRIVEYIELPDTWWNRLLAT
jgi:hypothetical protein